MTNMAYLEQDTRAAAAFWREVRKFSENAKPWTPDAIFYQVKPDEAYDFTLVSKRVYGKRSEFLAVMAAASVDSVDCELKQKTLVLPSLVRLNYIKRLTGFESDPELRYQFSPTWKRDDE